MIETLSTYPTQYLYPNETSGKSIPCNEHKGRLAEFSMQYLLARETFEKRDRRETQSPMRYNGLIDTRNTFSSNFYQSYDFDSFVFAQRIKKDLSERLFRVENMTVEEKENILYYLFEALEDCLIMEKYNHCNKFLFEICSETENYPVYILIGILTATFPWKEKLQLREAFFYQTKLIVDRKYNEQDAKAMLKGLN